MVRAHRNLGGLCSRAVSPTTSRAAAPYALFFLSGISGLVYQVVWVRQFGNIFGNTVHSAALVTAVFMCGLGAGSYLAGVWADRHRARGPRLLLAAYGWSEALIGALGVALAAILPRLGALSAAISSYARDARGWHELSLGSSALRYTIAAMLLAPMTLLMGGTLTLLIRHLVAGELTRAGLRIGALYGLNTAGAALGAFLTDFALVPGLGLFRAQLVAAAINVAVGALAVSLAARAPVVDGGSPAEPGSAPKPPAVDGGSPAGADDGDGRHLVRLTAAAIALTGFAGMGMEIVWFRFLTGALAEYRAVFSLMLTVMLAAMWAGSTLGGYAHRRWGKPATSYVVVEALFVLVTLGLLAVFDRTAVDRHLAAALHALPPGEGLGRASQCWAMIRAIAPLVALPSLLMGCSFPLANANIQRVEEEVGRRAGALYLANTAGSVLGSLLAGFVLLPRLGAQTSVLVLAIVAGAAIVPLHLSTRRGLGDDRPLGAGDYVFAGAFTALVIALSAWGMLLPDDLLRSKMLPDAGERYLDVSEGQNEVLAVSVGHTGARRLWTNGHSMSNTSPEAQRYMRAFSHVPLLSLEAPKSVLVICFGVGNTVNAASLHPSVERIDVADLSKNVLDHAGWFAATNGGVLADPRVSVFVNDGRQHLRMEPPGTYDLVTLEPPPINHAGVSALYSKEFYELARSRLTDGGYVTQWLPVQQLDGPETLALVRAFVDVFPGAVLLSGERWDLVLMGAKGPPIALDPAAIARRVRDRPRVAEDLDRVALGRPAELFGTFTASADTLLRATAGAAPVTDDAPSMEYSVISKVMTAHIPHALFDVGGVYAACPSCRGLPDLDAHLRVLDHLYASTAFLRYETFAPVPLEVDFPSILEGDDGSTASAVAHSAYLLRVAGIEPNGMPLRLRRSQLAVLEAYVGKHPDQALPSLRLGLAYLATDAIANAEAPLRRAVELAPDLVPARFALALALRRARKPDLAVAEYRRGLDLAPRDVPGRVGLVEALIAAGHGEEAAPEVARVLALDPDNGPAHATLCVERMYGGAIDEARKECKRALDGGATLDPKLVDQLFGP
jgi:spermidine synthase